MGQLHQGRQAELQFASIHVTLRSNRLHNSTWACASYRIQPLKKVLESCSVRSPRLQRTSQVATDF